MKTANKLKTIVVTIRLDPNGLDPYLMVWFKAMINTVAILMNMVFGSRYSMPTKGVSDWGTDTIELKGTNDILHNSYPSGWKIEGI